MFLAFTWPCCLLRAAPLNQGEPKVSGISSYNMLVTWNPPERPNGPNLGYLLERSLASFSTPPPAVTSGIRMTGSGFYKFPHTALPEGVAFTGEVWS